MMVFDHSEPPMEQEELMDVQVEDLGIAEEIHTDTEAAIQEEMLAGGQINPTNDLQVPQEEKLPHQESSLDSMKLDKAIKEELAINNEEDLAGEKVEQGKEDEAAVEVDKKKKEEVTVAQKKLPNFLNAL